MGATDAAVARAEVRAQAGPQEQALSSEADIMIFGGSAGCGKTFMLLLEPIRYVDIPEFGAVIFRRESPEITNQGGLWDESARYYPELGAQPNQQRLEWTFPSGAKVRFSHLQREDDKFSWKGAQVPLLEFDQLESFSAGQFWYLISRNRDPAGKVRPFVRGSCNPVPEDDSVGGWLHRLISWWLDEETGLPRPERSGVLRWFVRVDEDRLEWFDSHAEAEAAYPERDEAGMLLRSPLTMTFIPGRLEDNPAMVRADPEYRTRLLSLPRVERERLLGGNWKVRPTAGSVFDRAWFEVVDVAPAVARRVRYWDKAGTEGAGAYSVGVRVAEVGGVYYVEDVARGQWSPERRNAVVRQVTTADGPEVAVWFEQEPGSGGKESAQISTRELAGYNVRVETVTGDKVTRAGPLSAQAEAGNVKLVRGEWNEAYLSELHGFPEGKYKDQVDASSGAFNKLALGGPLVVGPLGTPPVSQRRTLNLGPAAP